MTRFREDSEGAETRIPPRVGFRSLARGKALILCIPLLLSTTDLAVAQKGSKLPPTGTVFHFKPTAPKWATCDLDFRDPTEKLWPNFLFGKPGEEGRLAFDPDGSAVRVVLKCDQMAQRNGEQTRRVIGELWTDKPPTASLTITSLGKWSKEIVDNENKKGKKTIEYVAAEGVLELAGRKVPAKGRATMKFRFEKKTDAAESVYLDMQFAVRAADLGLAKTTGDLSIRGGATGYVTPPAGK